MTENEVKSRGSTLVKYSIKELCASLRIAKFNRDYAEERCIKHAIYLKRHGKIDGLLKY